MLVCRVFWRALAQWFAYPGETGYHTQKLSHGENASNRSGLPGPADRVTRLGTPTLHVNAIKKKKEPTKNRSSVGEENIHSFGS